MSSYSDKSETYRKQEHCYMFLNLNYEDHINLIGTDLLNLVRSSILVSYFFSCLSISTLLYPGCLYYEA